MSNCTYLTVPAWSHGYTGISFCGIFEDYFYSFRYQNSAFWLSAILVKQDYQNFFQKFDFFNCVHLYMALNKKVHTYIWYKRFSFLILFVILYMRKKIDMSPDFIRADCVYQTQRRKENGLCKYFKSATTNRRRNY